MATALVERMLEQHVAGMMIQPKQSYMLATATQMLQANGVVWPSSFELVLTKIARRAELVPEITEVAPHGDDVVVHMSQFLSDVERTQGSQRWTTRTAISSTPLYPDHTSARMRWSMWRFFGSRVRRILGG